MKRLIFIVITTALAAACATHLPKPEVDVPRYYMFGGGFTDGTDTLGGCWWKIFGDPRLDSLELHALANNKNLAAAALKIEASRQKMKVVRAAFLPTLNAQITADGQYKTPTGDNYEFLVEPAVTWDVSLFGALRNTKRQALAEILSTQWAYRGVLLSLTNEVASTYFTMLQSERCLDIARRSYTLRTESEALIDSLMQHGFSTGLDLDQAKSLVYTAEADISQYYRALEQSQLTLNTLLGESPHYVENLGIGARLYFDTLPENIPIGLPSDIMEKRPDIMEAYYKLQAAAAQVGIARSNRFPSIQLTGSGGLFNSAAKSLFTQGYWNWQASGSIIQPLLSFGKLKNNEKIARNQYRQAALGYEQTVLAALENVEASLLNIETYRTQIVRYRDFVEANKRIAIATSSLYTCGMSSYLDVISTEQSWYTSQMTLVGLIAQQYINYANLVMALGNGWQAKQ